MNLEIIGRILKVIIMALFMFSNWWNPIHPWWNGKY